MAKKKAKRKKSEKRAAPHKARSPKKASKKTARKKTTTSRPAQAGKQRAAKSRGAKRTRLSRGLDSGRTGLIPESEQERTFAAGQSGDTEGLSDVEEADSESVEELAEEGQDYEAEIVEGVERAGDHPGEEVRTDVREEERPRPKRVTL
ncbi:MAG: hypothetical protein WA020_12570 [Candidatus Acidiferrales bacterium]